MTKRQAPEVLLEAPGSEWLSVADAAVLLGLTERAARDWIKRHAIAQRGSRPILVDAHAIRAVMTAEGTTFRKSPEPSPEVSGSASEPIEAQYHIPDVPLVPLPAILEQLGASAQHVVDLSRRNEALALEVGRLRERTEHLEAERVQALAPLVEQIADQANALSRLQAERDAAFAEVERLRSMQQRILEEMPIPIRPGAPPEQPLRAWWRFWGALMRTVVIVLIVLAALFLIAWVGFSSIPRSS